MGIIQVRHLFRCLAYYLVGMFIFLLLSLESSLYNMVLSSLSDVCFQMFCLDLCIFQCVSFHPLFSDDDGIINSMDIRFSKLQETWRAASWVARIWTQFRNWTTVQLLSHVLLFVTPWTAAYQASLSIINSWSLLKLMSCPVGIEGWKICPKFIWLLFISKWTETFRSFFYIN